MSSPLWSQVALLLKRINSLNTEYRLKRQCNTQSPPLPHSSQDVDVYIGQRRTALLHIGTQENVGRTLEQLLAHLKPRIKQVLQVMSFSHADITAALSDRVRLSPGNKESFADSMRAFKSSPGWLLGHHHMLPVSIHCDLGNTFSCLFLFTSSL